MDPNVSKKTPVVAAIDDQPTAGNGGGTQASEVLSLRAEVAALRGQLQQERRQAQATQAELAAALDALVEHAPIGLALLDRELRYLRINQPLATLCGGPAAALLGQTLPALVSDLAAQLEPLATRVLATGLAVQDCELAGQIAGQERLVQVSIYPVRVGAEVSGLSVYALDLTERRRAERGAAVLSRANAAFVALDVDAALQTLTEAVVPFVGDGCVVELLDDSGDRLTIAALAHRDAAHLPSYRQLWDSGAETCGQGVGPLAVVQSGTAARISCRRAEGRSAISGDWLGLMQALQIESWMGVPLSVRGCMIGVLSLSRMAPRPAFDEVDQCLAEKLARRAALAIELARFYEQTLHEQARAELAAGRMERLQAFTAALSQALTPQQIAEVVAHGGVMALGAKAGLVAILNSEETEFEFGAGTGYPPGALEKWTRYPFDSPVPIRDALVERQLIVLEDRAARLLRYPSLTDVPPDLDAGAWVAVPILHADRAVGALGLNFAAPRQFDEAERALMLTLGRQAAVALERARLFAAEARAHTAEQLANRAKDEFLATVSHELRTPLNAILGWTQLLRAPTFAAEKRERALATIERNARSQSKLIDDLLDLSRIISGKLTLNVGVVDPLAAIEAALDGIRPAAEAKRVQLQSFLLPNLGLILADAERVQQVALNLLTNAVKFTPAGGVVKVELRRRASEIELRVADTGAGIEPEFLPFVFERFRQADSSIRRAQGGLGLGLAIARYIIELHSGRITAQSAGVGCGATFVVTIPVASSVELGMSRSLREVGVGYPEGIAGLRVLIVDDEPDAREVLAELLQRGHATVTLAASAAEAFHLLVGDPPDVLISDIGMPGEDGYTLLRRVRALPADQGGRTRAIALTAYASSEDRKQALLAGYDVHISKPVDSAELLAVLANLGRRILDR
jgi:PAS domain S-box-containing protein